MMLKDTAGGVELPNISCLYLLVVFNLAELSLTILPVAHCASVLTSLLTQTALETYLIVPSSKA
jgi:hypothetical protein